jgi:hypothetical protein
MFGRQRAAMFGRQRAAMFGRQRARIRLGSRFGGEPARTRPPGGQVVCMDAAVKTEGY